ncbi:hypothetical protein WN51_02718 [Melipona quadrifasciata]|uniref:Uncharacterized protein n=1 Tax=Melipona quadrifasciata TaxID=166423 RepID=A0A0M9AAS4_9HYME|nr:hypothetical protein WN51_02718 [Melipona quadrifasciata]
MSCRYSVMGICDNCNRGNVNVTSFLDRTADPQPVGETEGRRIIGEGLGGF